MAISHTPDCADVWDLSRWHSNRVQKHFWAGECFRVTLQCCMTMLLGWHWSAYRPGFESGPVRKVRSREFMRVCYRINILGSQLSPNSINLVPALSWDGNCIQSGVTQAMRHRHRGLSRSTAKDRDMSIHAYVPSGVAIFTLPLYIPIIGLEHCTWCRRRLQNGFIYLLTWKL